MTAGEESHAESAPGGRFIGRKKNMPDGPPAQLSSRKIGTRLQLDHLHMSAR